VHPWELLEAVEDTAKELCMPMRAKMSSMTMSIRRKRLDMSDNALPKVMTTMYRPFHTCACEAQHPQHPKRPNDTQEGQVEAEAANEERLENPYGHGHGHEVDTRAFQPSPQYPMQPRP
jgi:hypothetical protein